MFNISFPSNRGNHNFRTSEPSILLTTCTEVVSLQMKMAIPSSRPLHLRLKFVVFACMDCQLRGSEDQDLNHDEPSKKSWMEYQTGFGEGPFRKSFELRYAEYGLVPTRVTKKMTTDYRSCFKSRFIFTFIFMDDKPGHS